MGLSERAIDGRAPDAVVRPESVEALAGAVREAASAGSAIVAWGGGTRIGVGDPPVGYRIALELGALCGVLAHEPGDLVVTVRAGTTLAALAEALAPTGQRWPVEIGDPERATVGGVLSGAAFGPSRLTAFHPRDWVIGVTAVLGDGTIAKAGGRVVKNVSGYDLTRLYSGSHGTLAIIAEAALKLTAVPAASRTLVAAAPNFAAGCARAEALLAAGLPVDALAVHRDGTGTRIVARTAGVPAAVDRIARVLAERLGATEADGALWSELAARPLRTAFAARLVSPRPLPDALAGEVLAYPGTGTAYLLDAPGAEALRALRATLEGDGGALIVERADPALRAAAGGAWGRAGLPLGVAAALKARFDPQRILAPGRMPGC